MSSEKTPSENIAKLRLLVDELCRHDIEESDLDEYRATLKTIKEVVQIETDNVIKEDDKEGRLKCYEKMCSTIQIILNKIKIA